MRARERRTGRRAPWRRSGSRPSERLLQGEGERRTPVAPTALGLQLEIATQREIVKARRPQRVDRGHEMVEPQHVSSEMGTAELAVGAIAQITELGLRVAARPTRLVTGILGDQLIEGLAIAVVQRFELRGAAFRRGLPAAE